MSVLFPVLCLLAAPVATVAPLFFSIPAAITLVLRLGAYQATCVLLVCAAAYFALHGVGAGVLPALLHKKLLAQFALLESGRESRQGSARPAAVVST